MHVANGGIFNRSVLTCCDGLIKSPTVHRRELDREKNYPKQRKMGQSFVTYKASTLQ